VNDGSGSGTANPLRAVNNRSWEDCRLSPDAALLCPAPPSQSGTELPECPDPLDGHAGIVPRRTSQTSNSTGGVSARPLACLARFASRWSNVANPEARELRAMCSVSAKSRSLSNASSATRTASRTGQQRRRVKVLQATRGAARRRLHHARHPGQTGRRHRPDDAQLQPIRLFEHFDPGARAPR